MRHAQASFNAASDRDRAITDLGARQTKELLEKNTDNLSAVRTIWSSDLLRAKQTAKIAADLLNLSVNEKTFLSPDGDPRKVLAELDKLDSDETLLMVSHQPLVGELVSLLVNGNFQKAHPYATSEFLLLDLDMAQPGMATLVRQYLPAY